MGSLTLAAGAGAAAKARRTDEQAEIVIFEKGPFVSFANCGLPYYVGEEIKDRKDLLVQTPESLWRRFRIKVHVRHEVLRIDRTNKKVEVRDVAGRKTFLEPYDRLILCPGAGAIIPNLPGLPAANVFTLRTIPDSDAIKDWITQEKPKHAVIIGAGFIGLEAAEAFSRRMLAKTFQKMEKETRKRFWKRWQRQGWHKLERRTRKALKVFATKD